jgi:hypothetical protein
MKCASVNAAFWQSDCDAYRKLNRPFQLRDVKSRTQEAFALIYALHFGFNYERDGSTVTFSPR